MIFPLPKKLVRYWKESKKCKYALESYYVSNLETQQLRESRSYLNKWAGDTAFYQIVQLQNNIPVIQPYCMQYFNEEFYLRSDIYKPRLEGRYLRIIHAYEREEHSEYIEKYIIHTINLLRLRYGFAAAVECAVTVTREFYPPKISVKSLNGKLITAFGDGCNGNLFFENGVNAGVKNIEVSTLKVETSILMNEAMNNSNMRDRFLLLWIALEAQIGKGDKRRKFCKDELCSKKINAEMKRLHDIRGGIVHIDGQTLKNKIQPIDVHTLFELIRISALPACAERQKLVQLVEARIDSQ